MLLYLYGNLTMEKLNPTFHHIILQKIVRLWMWCLYPRMLLHFLSLTLILVGKFLWKKSNSLLSFIAIRSSINLYIGPLDGNLTMEKSNPSLLSYNPVGNCPCLIVMFMSKNVATLSLPFCFFNSDSDGKISMKRFLNSLLSVIYYQSLHHL